MNKGLVISTSLLALTLLVAGCNSSSSEESEGSAKTEQTAKGHATTNKEKGTEQEESSKPRNEKTLELEDEEYTLSDQKTYNVTYDDTTWNAAKVNVDKVEIDTLDEPQDYDSLEDDTINIKGFLRIHMSVTPNRDINFYPTQGTIVAGSEQEEATEAEGWDGEVSNGATKDGWVSFPLKSIDGINSVRLKFDADYDTDDIDDDDFSKTYDMTLNLQQ